MRHHDNTYVRNIIHNLNDTRGCYLVCLFLFFILEKVYFMNIYPIHLFVCSDTMHSRDTQ